MGRDQRLNPFPPPHLPPPSVVRDQYGRILKKGDAVFVQNGFQQQPFEIVAIEEVLDARDPVARHSLDVTLRCMMKFRVAKDMPDQTFLRIVSQAEIDEGEIIGISRTRPTGESEKTPPPPADQELPTAEAKAAVQETFEELRKRLAGERATPSALDEFPSEVPTPKGEIQ